MIEDKPMTPRMTDYIKRAEAAFKPMFALEAAINASPLEHGLRGKH